MAITHHTFGLPRSQSITWNWLPLPTCRCIPHTAALQFITTMRRVSGPELEKHGYPPGRQRLLEKLTPTRRIA